METTPHAPPRLSKPAARSSKRRPSRRAPCSCSARSTIVPADTVRRLIALDAASHAPIHMLVSSPGGHLESGDTDPRRHPLHRGARAHDRHRLGRQRSHAPVSVRARERRFCLPQTRFLIHQPSGGAGGQATDIAIQAREIIKARERIAGVIARETGQPLENVLVDIERDSWMGPEEAIEYGLISRVIQNRSELG